jgi:hypothetical protein
LLHRAGGLHEIHLALGLAAALGQQHLGQFHHRRFHRQEAEALEIAPDGVQHVLEGDLVTGQQLHDPGRGARLDHGRNSERSDGAAAESARRPGTQVYPLRTGPGRPRPSRFQTLASPRNGPYNARLVRVGV